MLSNGKVTKTMEVSVMLFALLAWLKAVAGSMAGIIIVIISGTDNAGGMHCIKVFIHGHMVLNMCQSNCKTDLAKGANYNMKNQCGPMISNYH
jgi:hypothetical protein